jgi:hypothetical protein
VHGMRTKPCKKQPDADQPVASASYSRHVSLNLESSQGETECQRMAKESGQLDSPAGIR